MILNKTFIYNGFILFETTCCRTVLRREKNGELQWGPLSGKCHKKATITQEEKEMAKHKSIPCLPQILLQLRHEKGWSRKRVRIEIQLRGRDLSEKTISKAETPGKNMNISTVSLILWVLLDLSSPDLVLPILLRSFQDRN